MSCDSCVLFQLIFAFTVSTQSRQLPDLRQVPSAFLIVRLNCAFVNFESSSQLSIGIYDVCRWRVSTRVRPSAIESIRRGDHRVRTLHNTVLVCGDLCDQICNIGLLPFFFWSKLLLSPSPDVSYRSLNLVYDEASSF